MEVGDEGVGWHEPARKEGTRRGTIGVRAAQSADVPGIVTLIQREVRRGNLLPRSRQNVEETLADWFVASDSRGLLGCVNLSPYPSGLLEVRSLAVDDRAQGRGVGTRLVQALIAEAGRRGGRTLFALTRAVPFFERLGFAVTSRELFPEKVWRACRVCPLIDNCDEIAVVKVLDGE